MRKGTWKALAMAVVMIAAPAMSHAVCGDVNGDDSRTASDALAVLKSAVGQNVDLECTADPLRPSQVRLYNAFNCASGSDNAILETDHGQDWSANNTDSYSGYQVVEESLIEGINYKQCGENIRFEGPVSVPPERRIVFFVVAAHPDFYGEDYYYLMMIDEGPRDGAPPSEQNMTGGQTFGMMGHAVK